MNGFISPADYLEIAKYDNAKELAKNAVLYQQNPMEAVGLGEPEMPLPFAPESVKEIVNAIRKIDGVYSFQVRKIRKVQIEA